MILVRFYCKAPGCNKMLDTIADPLPGWLAYVPRRAVSYNVRKCPRHGGTTDGFRRLAKPGRIATLSFGPQRVPPNVLWRLIDEARDTRRTVPHRV